jgi:ATP diphosphatase
MTTTPLQPRRLAGHHGAPARSRTRLPVGREAGFQPPSRRTPSRKPTKSPMRSTAATGSDLRDELGDLLLQVVFHAQMAEGSRDCSTLPTWLMRSATRCAAVIRTCLATSRYADLAAQKRAWEDIKDGRTRRQGASAGRQRAGGHFARLPEWKRALKLQERAATVGFDWPDPQPVLDKLAEEVDEVRAEFADGADPARLEDEIGDVLFVMVNLARHAGVDFSVRCAREREVRAALSPDGAAGGRWGQPLSSGRWPRRKRLWQRAKAARAQGLILVRPTAPGKKRERDDSCKTKPGMQPFRAGRHPEPCRHSTGNSPCAVFSPPFFSPCYRWPHSPLSPLTRANTKRRAICTRSVRRARSADRRAQPDLHLNRHRQCPGPDAHRSRLRVGQCGAGLACRSPNGAKAINC